MKDHAIGIYLNQLAGEVEKEINREADTERNCRLQDVKELLGRAWAVALQVHREPNDLIGDFQEATNRNLQDMDQ